MIPLPSACRPRPGRPSSALVAIVLAVGFATGCGGPAPEGDATGSALDALRSELASAVDASGAEVVGVYYRSLAPHGDSLAMDADVRMHAASTMKVPVMMQLYADKEAGVRSLDDSLRVTTRFRSIVDGSPYELPASSDSDTILYRREGESVAYRELIERMITRSSNLATNLLIAEADPDRIARLMRRIGADSMEVLRGVEDLKAFEAGLSNTTTARSLGAVMRAVATGDGFAAASRDSMVAILERQEFRENIPAGLPPQTRVANKTGWITGIHHDAAIVFPDGAPPYVLVLMVRGPLGDDRAAGLMSELSRRVWRYHKLVGAVAARSPGLGAQPPPRG